MSEADLIYTETLMQRGKESYTGKEIVILGGGDGGLLWELLKENPKHVTMLEVRISLIQKKKEIEVSKHALKFLGNFLMSFLINFYPLYNPFILILKIDDVVMEACSQHMRSICGDCLDKRKGDNYEVDEQFSQRKNEILVFEKVQFNKIIIHRS